MADSDAQPSTPVDTAVAKFIARWSKAEAAERANYQMFLTELCDLLGVDHPDPAGADNAFNRYVFDRSIVRTKHDSTTVTVYADLYKRGSFILETKQGANAKSGADSAQLGLLSEDPANTKTGHGVRGTAQWDRALERAYNQARGYIRDLPAHEGRPPFLIVCDVGYVIELYSEFTCTGGTYVRFPDPKSHRIHLDDLRDEKIRQRLRAVWTDPLSLDPSRHAARVTREVAEHLARLAGSLEADGHSPQAIATFLQRCLFTMFAEDTGLLPPGAFIDMLIKLKDHPEGFAITAQNLWRDMASGNPWSVALMQKIAYFNGGLFENATALPLSSAQIALLIGAAKPDWSDVEPAIFGTLLERALSPRDRHKLGAHYTPRSYVERLVKPTIIDPLRARWDDAKTAAAQLDAAGDRPGALKLIKAYHHELCRITVLDPACGSGNFLYVTLEHMKRLEGEVLELLEALGDTELTFEMEQFKVRPQQFHGLEINAQAVAIAQLVLWIGYFQWHKKNTGQADTGDRPLLPKEQTIRAQDAVLAYDKKLPRKDADGQFVTIWDGRTTKPHPVTQREVPDESARIPVYDYTNPRRADWPKTDYIVGNPPFIGASRMRDLLGDGYTEALRATWKGDVPDSADFVMFWWEKAAALTRAGHARRFGFITTNSIHQTFNRRVLEKHLGDPKTPLTVAYAIPDHPWVDSTDGAAVRIAMTVATTDPVIGELNRVTEETEVENGEHRVELDTDLGKIAANLKIGADLTSVFSLQANQGLASEGIKPHGMGFVLSRAERQKFIESDATTKPYIKPYKNGRDMTQTDRDVFIIDLHGLTDLEVRAKVPSIYQHVYDNVRPERLENKEAYRRENWWLFGRKNTDMRNAISDLTRYLVSVKTAKHRVFQFVEAPTLPDSKLICVSMDDSTACGVLSSVIHGIWTLNIGARLGFGNDPTYVVGSSFNKFPFPDLPETEPLKAKIRDLGEQLDAHRKRQQAAHADLTLTGLYNVVEKLRREEPLTDKERQIHDDGLAAVLKQLHDELDTAVLAAYGWADLATKVPLADRLARGDETLEQALLTRLVALNHARAAEEAKGTIRWLRPDYQNPQGATKAATQTALDVDDGEAKPATPAAKLPWPATLPDRVAALRALLPSTGPDASALAAHFGKKTKLRLQEITQILTTLKQLGQL
ncbi:MAG: DNA methyltransferase [Verrucomicrobiota bacterium]